MEKQKNNIPFPVEALPDPLFRAVTDIARIYQGAPSMVATDVLVLNNYIRQKRLMVEWLRKPQPIGLRGMSIVTSGERKTSTLNPLLEPIHVFQKEMRRKCFQNHKLIFSSCTPEALRGEASNEGSTILFVNDEGSVFKSRALRDRGFLNSLSDGTPTCIELRSGSFYIENPRLSMLIKTQEKPFLKFVQDRRKIAEDVQEDGFIARFLMCRPPALKGTRFHNKNNFLFNEGLKKFQEMIAVNVFQEAQFTDVECAKVLVLSPAAEDYLFARRDQLELDIRENCRYEPICEFVDKYCINTCKIAAGFHDVKTQDTNEIDEVTLKQTCRIMDWYLEETLSIVNEADIPQEERDVELLKEAVDRHFERNNFMRFPTYQVGQICPNRLRDKSYRKYLDILIDRGVYFELKENNTKYLYHSSNPPPKEDNIHNPFQSFGFPFFTNQREVFHSETRRTNNPPSPPPTNNPKTSKRDDLGDNAIDQVIKMNEKFMNGEIVNPKHLSKFAKTDQSIQCNVVIDVTAEEIPSSNDIILLNSPDQTATENDPPVENHNEEIQFEGSINDADDADDDVSEIDPILKQKYLRRFRKKSNHSDEEYGYLN